MKKKLGAVIILLVLALCIGVVPAAAVVLPIEVAVDIKPESCPNPINVNEKGVISVAIMGTDEFDATTIDPASVQLQGVSPLRWALEDVATPYEPYIGKTDAYECHILGPDGYLDLTLKFKAQEILIALGEVNDRDVLALPLTGDLKEEFNGTEITGEDVVVIIAR
jgi:hypothetical protein